MGRERVLFLGPETSPLIAWLRAHGDEVTQTDAKLRADEIAAAGHTFLVSYGYRHILRSDVLALFPGRAINLHISYLPWNRGADPNLWSFVDDTPKGVTIHQLDEGVDTGAILLQEEVRLDLEHDTLATSYAKLQTAVQDLFKRSWPSIKEGACAPQPQVGEGSLHRAREKDALAPLLTAGWETPVKNLRAQVADRSGESGGHPVP